MEIVPVLLLTLAMGDPAYALAEPANPIESVRVTVSVRDLDLQREGDADVALRRLWQAAGQACAAGPPPEALETQMSSAYAACRRQAVAEAVARANAPGLQQRYARAQANRRAGFAKDHAPPQAEASNAAR